MVGPWQKGCLANDNSISITLFPSLNDNIVIKHIKGDPQTVPAATFDHFWLLLFFLSSWLFGSFFFFSFLLLFSFTSVCSGFLLFFSFFFFFFFFFLSLWSVLVLFFFFFYEWQVWDPQIVWKILSDGSK